jgi:hypothetical protein
MTNTAQKAEKTARDARLDKLQKAVAKWASEEETRIKNEVKFLKSILKGRTGAGRLTAQNTADASTRLVNEIELFLSK